MPFGEYFETAAMQAQEGGREAARRRLDKLYYNELLGARDVGPAPHSRVNGVTLEALNGVRWI